jgi:hypothetical protein
MTRWQGTTIEIGLRPLAAPTAREAVGAPRRAASAPEVVVGGERERAERAGQGGGEHGRSTRGRGGA